MNCVISKTSELYGRWIAYGGGSGLFAFSKQVMAESQSAIENTSIPVSSFVALGGLTIVVARFAFDVFRYFDQRRNASTKESKTKPEKSRDD